jgi:hypothetical protein
VSAALLNRLAVAETRVAAVAATVAMPRLGPVELAERAGVVPDSWQRQVLTSAAPRLLLNCSRQSGKSTVCALLAVHTAIYEPGALVLLVSRAERQSKELFRKCLDAYRALGRPVDPETENKLELELVNGARIVALPGSEQTIRSFSGVRLLLIDEASRVATDTYAALRPMLAVSGGRLIALSTPFGTRGWWYEEWRSDRPWERYEIPATACPRITAAFLEEERASMGEWWYRQEYLCEFMDAQSQAFTRDEIDRAFSEEVEPWAL